MLSVTLGYMHVNGHLEEIKNEVQESNIIEICPSEWETTEGTMNYSS